MNRRNHFTQAIRVANFSNIHFSADYRLDVDSTDVASIVRQIRRYADLPYVFVASEEQVELARDVLSALGAIRSPCYPHAIFYLSDAVLDIDAPLVEIIRLASPEAGAIGRKINDYVATRLRFDADRLRLGNTGQPPERVDVVIVGGGITGLYAASRFQQSGVSFCILEKRDRIGGIWSMYANTTSRVNTSEAAYRLIEPRQRSNRDHSATKEILEDMTALAATVTDGVFLETEVRRIEKTNGHYQIHYTRGEKTAVIRSKGVILAINDRVGTPREATWDNLPAFRGQIVSGISDKAQGVDWHDKSVVIVGMGAFAIENARTALEGGASHVTVVCRRHGTICPKIIDYLNFATPYDEAFRHDKKSNIRNMMYWKKMYTISGATQPECWMGKVKHEGHTISVSDIWFVGHFLKKIETITGEISGMFANGVIVNGKRRVDADIVVNCIGFERNNSVAHELSGEDEMTNINYVDKDFMYLADAYIDDDAFNSFFGSSVLEMTRFFIEVFISAFDKPLYDEIMATPGIERIPLKDRRWSQYIAGAMTLVNHFPDFHDIAQRQVVRRTNNFLEKHDLQTYIEENKREWIDLHAILAGKPLADAECMPYVFERLLPS
jgi:hypothetical protein